MKFRDLIQESSNKWEIKTTKSGKRYACWFDTNKKDYLIVYNYNDEICISYSLYGGTTSGNDEFDGTINPEYYEEFNSTVPKFPKAMLTQLDEIYDDEIDTIPSN